MPIDVTDEERKLIGFGLACYIEDAEKRGRKLKFPPDHPYMQQLAKIQRLTYTKVIPESLTGDDQLADGSILKKVTP